MSEFDQEALTAAITGAIRDGFATIRSRGGSDTSRVDPGRPPDDETDVSDITSASKGMRDLEEDSKNAMQSAKEVSAGITGIVGGMMTGIGDGAAIAFNNVANMNEELDKEVKIFRDIQKFYGGVSEEAFAAGEALEGTAGQAMGAFQHLVMVSSAGEEMSLSIESGAMKGKNALIALFRDPAEAANMFNEVLENVNQTNVNLAKSLEAQGKAEMERIAIIRKRMNITDREMGDMLRRQYAFTGEASSKIFEDIASVSVSLAKTTGGSAEDLKEDILDIMEDVDKFGNIGVDSAGRIAGALNQLGLDFQTFSNMTNNFMNFDSAASKMGELSALFGIQMDAMEMTYLANEDQEEFLFRMREEILDAGLDVENMSKTRQRALADQLGMNVTQMQQFMREGELAADQAEMTAATDAAEQMDGMATAVDKFGGAFEGAYRGAAEFEKSLRAQVTYTDEVMRNITKQRIQYGKIPEATNKMLKVSDAARANAIAQLKVENDTLVAGLAKVNPMFAQFATSTGEVAANAGQILFEAAGLQTSENGEVQVASTVTVEASAVQSQQTQAIIAAQSVSTERAASNEIAIEAVLDNSLIMQAENQNLIAALSEEKKMPVTIQLDEGKFGDRLFNVMQQKFGRFVIQNDG